MCKRCLQALFHEVVAGEDDGNAGHDHDPADPKVIILFPAARSADAQPADRPALRQADAS